MRLSQEQHKCQTKEADAHFVFYAKDNWALRSTNLKKLVRGSNLFRADIVPQTDRSEDRAVGIKRSGWDKKVGRR
jgi:hypothetical protein